MIEDYVGHMAGFLTTVSFIPQVIKAVKTKDTKGISLQMYIIFSAGVALWLAYGIMLKQWPTIIANAVTLILALIVLFIKTKEKN